MQRHTAAPVSASASLPGQFSLTVAVHDEAALRELFALRLLQGVYSKRPVAENSMRRQVFTLRRSRIRIREILLKNGVDVDLQDRNPDQEDQDQDEEEDKRKDKKRRIEEIQEDATADRVQPTGFYETKVNLPLRMSLEEAVVATQEGVAVLEKVAERVWVARLRKAGEEVEDPLAGLPYPSSGHEKRCFLVFKALWKLGWIVTRGTNFGSEFMIYTSDPGTVHSRFMVIVIDAEKEREKATSVKWTSIAALATKVKKQALLASVHGDSPNDIKFTLMEGCLFRRTDFLQGKVEEELALKVLADKEDQDDDDEFGVRTSIAV